MKNKNSIISYVRGTKETFDIVSLFYRKIMQRTALILLAYGTLLGAVRTENLFPGDDDIDI